MLPTCTRCGRSASMASRDRGRVRSAQNWSAESLQFLCRLYARLIQSIDCPTAVPMDPKVEPRNLLPLTLGAIGVVYGDIGTSPLYTIKEVFSPGTGVPLDAVHLI